MSAHTPGPWTVDGVEVRGGPRNESVVWELGNDNTADALLIAAAPDLLAALKALVDSTERYDNPSDCGVPSHDDTMIAARAAIAKAEGRA